MKFMYFTKNKKRGNIIFLTTLILMFISQGIFISSIILKKDIYREKILKDSLKKLELQDKERTIFKVYRKSTDNMTEDELSKYMTFKEGHVIWDRNYKDEVVYTDSGFFIDCIKINEKIINFSEGSKSNNYRNIIRNYSIYNSYNYMIVLLKKKIKNIKIGETFIGKGELVCSIEVKYFYTGHDNENQELRMRVDNEQFKLDI